MAQAVCEIPPTLVADGVSQALGRDQVVADELALWDRGGPSAGLDAIGPAGLGVLRANSTCRVVGREATAEGLRLTLERDEPDLTQQAVWALEEVQDLPLLTRTLELGVEPTADGPRVRLGLARAQAALQAAQALALDGHPAQAQAAVDALSAWFPDPLLVWERDALGGLAPVPPVPAPVEPTAP